MFTMAQQTAVRKRFSEQWKSAGMLWKHGSRQGKEKEEKEKKGWYGRLFLLLYFQPLGDQYRFLLRKGLYIE